MKVLVVGAAGKSGRAVVKQALAAGHEVTAFVHEAKGYLSDPNVRVVEGDARDRSAMDSAMLGQEAVIDTIGGKNPLKATTLEASAAATITASMQSSGVRRLVVISMTGEGESEANTNWYQRLFLATLLRAEMKDKGAMEALVDTSGLDWVIVRPPFLSDGLGTGTFTSFLLKLKRLLTRLLVPTSPLSWSLSFPAMRISRRPWRSPTASRWPQLPCSGQALSNDTLKERQHERF